MGAALVRRRPGRLRNRPTHRRRSHGAHRFHFAQVNLGFQSDRLVTGAPISLTRGEFRRSICRLTERNRLGDESDTRLRVCSHRAHECAAAARRSCGDHARGRRGAAGGAGLVPSGALSVSPAYFTTLGVPVIRGRAFSEQDRKESVLLR